MFRRTRRLLFLLLAMAVSLAAQTRLNGRSQIRNIPGTELPAVCTPGALFFKIDAPAGENWHRCSDANTWTVDSDKPWMSGTQVPASCAVGDLFFKTDAPAGENWYGCTSANTWSMQGNKPAWTSGTTLPSSCTVGQMFFKTDAVAGQNWFGCVAADSWTVQGDGTAGAGAYNGPKLPKVTFSESTATVGSDCGTLPCAAGFGGTTVQFTTPETFTITNQVTDANIAFFIDSAGNLKARYLGTSFPGVTLSAGLVADTSGTGYPASPTAMHLLALCAASGGRFTSCSDDRAVRLQTISSSGGTCSITPTATGVDLNCHAAAVSAYTTVLGTDGNSLPPETQIQFMGAGVSVTPATDKTVVMINGGGNGGAIDHAAHDYEYDEFNGTLNTFKLGWVVEQGGGYSTHRSGTFNHPGIHQLQSGTTAGTYAQLQLGPQNVYAGPFAPDQPVTMHAIIYPDQADDATSIRFGAIEWTLGLPSTGYYLEKAFGENTWRCVAKLSGTATRQDTGVQVTAATWYALEVVRTPTSVSCKVASLLSSLAATPATTVTTTLPTGSHPLKPMFQVGTNTNALRSIGIDFYEHDATVAR